MNKSNSSGQVTPEVDLETCILFTRMLWEWAFSQRIECIKLCHENGVISSSNHLVCLCAAAKTYKYWQGKKIKNHKTLKPFQLIVIEYMEMALMPIPHSVAKPDQSPWIIKNVFTSN